MMEFLSYDAVEYIRNRANCPMEEAATATISDMAMLAALQQATLGSVLIEGFSFELQDHLVALGHLTCGDQGWRLTERGWRALALRKAIARKHRARATAARQSKAA